MQITMIIWTNGGKTRPLSPYVTIHREQSRSLFSIHAAALTPFTLETTGNAPQVPLFPPTANSGASRSGAADEILWSCHKVTERC